MNPVGSVILLPGDEIRIDDGLGGPEWSGWVLAVDQDGTPMVVRSEPPWTVRALYRERVSVLNRRVRRRYCDGDLDGWQADWSS